jgi:uncharacterized protein GlcG (DUF336 family)
MTPATARLRVGVTLLGLIMTMTVMVGCTGTSGGGDGVVTDTADVQAVAASDPPPPTGTSLTAADVSAAVQAAAEALPSTSMVIAVVDREGIVLGLYRKAGAPTTVAGNFAADLAPVNANDFAVSLARTGAFFSNDEAPLSSRTVRFISGIHFPPGIAGTPNAELYGIENTNRGCPIVTAGDPPFNVTPITPPTSVNGGTCNAFDSTGCSLGIATGKSRLNDDQPFAVAPGGVPIFKNGRLVGGIGVTGVSPEASEFAAFRGSTPAGGFGPQPADPGVIFIDGIALPFVNQTTTPAGTVGTGVFNPAEFVTGPIASPRGDAGFPDGYLIGPTAGAQLTAAEVDLIVSQAVAQSLKTRAAIRLPPNRPAKMVIAVSDLNGAIIGLFRMPDSTIFSVDVAVTKARNVIYFSSPAGNADLGILQLGPGTAVSNRTISFGAQPLYPPGQDIEPSQIRTGPFFQIYLNDITIPCRQASQPQDIHQSGIVFFPGSSPLYKNGVIVGGLGVSGDGVAQDDLVTAAGATGFAPDASITADNVVEDGVRLPFFKFPQNPELL